MVDNQKTIDVRVKRELGSEGEPTGKYVFTVDNMYRFYYAEFHPARMEWHLEQAGYPPRQIAAAVEDMGDQYAVAGSIVWRNASPAAAGVIEAPDPTDHRGGHK